MAEVKVDEAMLSTHKGRWQQHINSGERCEEMARAGDGDGEGEATVTAFAMATVMAMVLAWMTGTAAALLPAMATTQESE